jgi:hypothetical protein
MATNLTVMSNAIGPDVIGCPRILIDKAILDALIRFCKDTHIIEKGFEHDVVAGDITAADNDSVNVNIATYVTDGRPILLTEFKIDGASYTPKELNLVNDLDDISEIAIQGVVFYNFPDSTHVKFYDIEAKAQRFYIKAVYVPLTTATTVDDQIYYDNHKAIEAGARAELMAMPNKDWSNPAMAVYYEGKYNDGMASAKIRKDKGKIKTGSRVQSCRWF